MNGKNSKMELLGSAPIPRALMAIGYGRCRCGNCRDGSGYKGYFYGHFSCIWFFEGVPAYRGIQLWSQEI